jgi:hypothetical protein
MVAMPCAEVVEVGGVLDIFHAANERLAQAGASDQGYAVEVVSPVTAGAAAPPSRHVVASRKGGATSTRREDHVGGYERTPHRCQ